MKRFNMFILFSLAILTALTALYYYRNEPVNFTSYDCKEHAYNIYPNTTMDSLSKILSRNYKVFTLSSWKYRCKKRNLVALKPGHYIFPSKIGNRRLINLLISNNQAPVKLTFTNSIRTQNHLAHVLSKQLLLDSVTIVRALSDSSFMANYQLTPSTAICMFMPDTYFVYWTISLKDLFNKMFEQYNSFWNAERLHKASFLGLSPTQVITVASIVECESNKIDEYGEIASLYINRLQRGMNLQACPTVIYANNDFTIRRVRKEHLQTDSPYNTYLYRGLPPGPIKCPNASTIDIVLNAPKTNILYMCAKSDKSGYHHFSSTYKEHANYAKTYHRMLNSSNIP